MKRFDPVVAGVLALVLLLTAAADQWLADAAYAYPGGNAQIVRGTVLRRDPAMTAWEALGTRQREEILQRLDVETDGGLKTVENVITGSPANDRLPDAGDEVLVRVRNLGRESYATLRELARDRWMVRLAGGVFAVIALVFGRKGARALAALAVSVLIALCLPQAILAREGNILILTLAAIVLSIGATYLILCGPGRKALSAMAGAALGIGLSGLLAVFVVRWIGLSGLHDQDVAALQRFTAARTLDFRALLVAGMLLGTLGVVMDVSIAVASAIAELAQAAPQLTAPQLRAHGMTVGRKVMGAMVMALALAYVGIHFSLFLLPHADPATDVSEVAGTERVTAEIARLLVGVIAVVWTVPATAWTTSWLERRAQTRRQTT